jgi:hypothetical protein
LSKGRKAKRSTDVGVTTAGFGILYLLHDTRLGEIKMLTSIPLVVTLAVSFILILAGITLLRNWRISFALYICALFASFTHAAFMIIFLIPAAYDLFRLLEPLSNGGKTSPFLSLIPVMPVLVEVLVNATCISGLVISVHKRREILSKNQAQSN